MRLCHFSATTVDAPYFKNISKGLSAIGMSVLCGDLCEETRPEWFQEAEGVLYFGLNARRRRSYPRAIIQLARLLRREHVDILQTHLFDAGLIGVLAAKLAKTRVVIVTRHHSDQVRMSGTRFHVALDRWMARHADCVVAVSDAVREYMISSDRIDPDRIEVIHLGFDFSTLSPTQDDRERVRAEFGYTREFVIGCVASFFRTKGHRYLLAAFNDLIREIPEARLLLIGNGDQSEVEAMIREFGLGERVVLAGYRKDVPACMRAMDVVVHPSLSEAFSQVLIEAMAVGTALVTTDVGGAPEVVFHRQTGMLVPPANAAAIVAAVLELYRNPEMRRRIAEAGQANVRRCFTVERMVEQQAACYRRLLERSLSNENIRVGTQI